MRGVVFVAVGVSLLCAAVVGGAAWAAIASMAVGAVCGGAWALVPRALASRRAAARISAPVLVLTRGGAALR